MDLAVACDAGFASRGALALRRWAQHDSGVASGFLTISGRSGSESQPTALIACFPGKNSRFLDCFAPAKPPQIQARPYCRLDRRLLLLLG